MMNSFALDQRAGENHAKNRRTLPPFRLGSGLESVDINAAWEIEEPFPRKPASAKRLRRFFGKHDDQIGQLVFFENLFAFKKQPRFPRCRSSICSLFPVL